MDPDEWADRMTALDIAEDWRGDAWDRNERTWEGILIFILYQKTIVYLYLYIYIVYL